MVLENFLADADILWDRAGKKLFEKPEARTGRIMRVQVTNRGVVEDLTGYTLNLGWTSTKDETKFGLDAFEAADITKGIFELEYTSGMLTNIGTLKAALQLVPTVGNTVESNNFAITVTRSAVDAEGVQSETSFSTLTTALVQVNGWNATIDGKVIDWEADMAATKQLYIDNMEEVESTYPIELNSVKQQLEQTLNKSAITLTHMFADNTARDAYFVANPSELTEQLFIKVGTGYQQYIEDSWTDSVPIVAEQLSATNQPITDTGNYFATDNTNDALQELGEHKVSTANPHAVTKAQVGLGNVDNTSDANKPVSTAMQTALNLKADKTTTDGLNTRLIAEETATANNKISAVKGKTFADVDARLEELETQAITVDARMEFEAKNDITNGDFSNGTTGWLGNPNFIVDGALKWQTAVDGFYNWYQAKNYPVGNKIYARMRVTNNAVPTALRLYVGPVGTNYPTAAITFIDVGTKDVSGIITTPSGATHIGIKGQVLSTAVDTTIDNVSFIDLTAAFGAGKEPTLAEMDRMMARYPNSWFDGTKPVQTIETLYQDILLKANKVQEAWITPTLVNSWVAFDTRTAKYKKADYGRVYLKGIVKNGTIGATIFTLPTGYRPDEALIFGAITVNVDGTVVCTSGVNTSVSLSGVNFFV